DVEFFDHSNVEECRERVQGGADAVVIDWIDPNSFLDSMKNPSLLALMSTGYSWIDTKKARELGISVSNVPGYAAQAVAEHLIGLMLAVARKIVIGDAGIRKGNKEKGYLNGIEMSGRRAGIIGLGNIGGCLARMLSGFGMEIYGYDVVPKDIQGVKNVSLDDLLRNSDIVFIVCDLNNGSRNMLNLEKLKLLKTSAILLASTWGVVDLGAITEILKNKQIYGAGFDVAIEGGEIALPQDFIGLENVVLTPHIGYNTKEAKIRQVDICISNIEKYLAGKSENIVN
ncbi:MAG: NAD(P)-dependent oxidoreductase, partial [Candidatus Paceibacterota bacterium]